MSSIDDRVVHMTFDNKQFEAGIASTLASLDKLNKGLQMQGATKGLKDVDAAAKGVSLSGIASGIDSIAGKFKTMSVVGITALTNLTNKVVDTGLRVAKSLTIDPIVAGFHNYETQINAVGTIVANTGLKGEKGLKKVNAALDELNTYANQTVYNFSDMAKNIGTFTAAGVGLKDSVNSIKGIANLAALSGSTSEQASTAMYQLSQAIAAGTVHLQDWNSVVNAGMGGKVFQKALVDTARASGVNIDKIIKKAGSFRESLQKGWLTSKILTQTLSQFTGDLTLKQIESMGYTKKQAEGILEMGKTAVGAATKIKTATQLADALKEEVATAWATIFKTIFGNITASTALFTSIHNVAESALTGPVYKLNALLQGWAKLGGRFALIDGLKLGFQDLEAVLKPIKEAFHDIFPPATAEELFRLTAEFHVLMENLKIGPATANELRRTFAGVFALFKIGWDIISAGGKAFLAFFKAVGVGSGGFLKLTASIGDFLVKVKDTIEQSGILTSGFASMGGILAVPIQLIQLMASSLEDLFGRFDNKKATQGLTQVSNEISSVSKFGRVAVTIWGALLTIFSTVGRIVDVAWQKISGFFHNLGTMGTTTNVDFGSLLAALDTGIFAGIILLVRKIVKYFTSGGHHGPVASIVDAIREPFEELTNTLKVMQGTLKAATLLEIATAVAVLAYAVSTISTIDSNGLTRASVAISVMFGQLLGSMAIFQKFIGTAGFAKLPFMMLSMIELATAVRILAGAVATLAKLDWNGLAKGLTGLAGTMAILAGGMKLIGNPGNMVLVGFGLTEVAGAIGGLVLSVTQLSGLNWQELAKGLTGLAVILASLGLFAKFAEGSGAGAIRTVGLILLATAIKILVSSIKDFNGLSWDTVGKGLAGIAALLASLALYTKFSDASKAGVLQGAGLILLATGIKILVMSVQAFDGMSWGKIAKGLTGVGVLLGSLALFTQFAKAGGAGVLQGVGIILLATGIRILVGAVESFSNLSWKQIAKGLVTLAGSLAVITGALYLIPPTAPLQASGILITATSLVLIAKTLKVMGDMSWGSIGKALTEMLGALTIITAALYVIPPTAPLQAAGVLIIAAAMEVIANVLVKMGAMSWGSIAKSLTVMAGSLTIIAGALLLMPAAVPGAAALAIVAGALTLMVPVLQAFGSLSWNQILKSLAELAGVFVVVSVGGLLLLPVVPILIGLGVAIDLIGAGVLAAGLGLSLFATALAGLAATVGVFDKNISKAGPGLVDAIDKILKSMIQAIVRETPKIVGMLLNMLVQMLKQLNKYVPVLLDEGGKLITAVLNGIAKNMDRFVTAATNIIVAFLNGIGKNMPRIVDAGFKLIIAFINGISLAIVGNAGALGDAGGQLAASIVEGIVIGLGHGVGKVVAAAGNLAESAIKSAMHVLDINSPSKVFIAIGHSVNEGFLKGLMSGDRKKVDQAFAGLANQIRYAMQSTGKEVQSLEAKLKKLTNARHRNNSEIAQTRKELQQAQKELKAEGAAYNEITKKLSSQHKALDTLADKHAKVTAAIQKERDTLANAIKTRDDYNKQIHDQYDVIPKIAADTTVSGFEDQLKTQIEKTKEFMNALQRLRRLGLSDVMYKELLADGIDALPFAVQLLADGRRGIAQVNDLGKQLDTASSALGKTASAQLYQAGVDAAQGLLKGLQLQQKALEKQMEHLADAMVNAIKKKLGIKSPSTVFTEVGRFSAQGVARGLDEMSGIVEASATAVGDKAVDSLKKSISGLAGAVTGNIDIRPTITPILDLSSVKKDAGQIGSMLNGQSLSVQGAYAKAANVSAGYMTDKSVPPPTSQVPPKQYTFNQYNNSPKALSEGEIYRQTKNQLSQVKEALP